MADLNVGKSAKVGTERLTRTAGESARAFGTGYSLVGKNYQTPDLVAKVTGRSKYAEDFRAEGMLFCRLVLSQMPHGRVTNIDASEALAMPGVKAILTENDIPPLADSLDDNGRTIRANKWGERALSNEPRFEGCPIMAVVAVDELTCAEAIEKIKIDMEPLPYVVDPLETFRPGGTNPHADGNVWVRSTDPKQPPMVVQDIKWTDQDFADYKDGKLPMGNVPDTWTFGDIDAGFKNAALVLDETFVTADVSHQCLEPRTAMAYWQNGKLYMHTGTQSTAQTVPAIARWMQMSADDVVLVSEYTGGAFGSKITAGQTLIIPAILSKKLGAPVMMRLSREDEHFVGRARPSIEGRVKVGFDKQGRILAIDMFGICNSGAYEPANDMGSAASIVSLLYQPPAMRFRGATVMTNTLTRSAMSSPGGLQGIAIFDPILAKAARKLNIDQVDIRRVNSPEGKASVGPVVKGKRAYTTSCFLKEAIDRGAEQFNWKERIAKPKRSGTRARGLGVAISTYVGGSIGYDGLLVITPEGRVRFHSGIGNLGTENMSDVHRAGAEILGVDWDQCDVIWGDTSRNMPYTCVSGGSQTTHAMTRAAHSVATAAKARLQEIAAKTHGGAPENYDVAHGHVIRKGGGQVMTFADASKKAIELGGIYDGHQAPDDVHKLTKTSVAALAGSGLVVSSKDTYPHDGNSYSFFAQFAEVEVDLETGKYYLTDFLSYGDVGTVLHPNALYGQVTGRTTLGIAHAISQKWVIDPEYGFMVSRRFYQTKPPTVLDVPLDLQWNALNIPDPETPVGARGVGEPPVGGGCAAVLNALSDALGDEIFRRTPVNSDTILTSLEAGHPMQHPLMAHI